LNYARSPDRILFPMRRVGPKGPSTRLIGRSLRAGSDQFVRISWDDALETIAARLRDVIATYGAEAIWPFLGSGNMGLIQGAYGAGRRFWNVLGASRHVQTICTIAGGFGTGYTLGDNRVGMDPETFHPRVSAVARRSDHRALGRVHHRTGQTARGHSPDRHSHRHRHSASRRRWHGRADDYMYSRRHW
jgi:hypothetical protein